MSGRSLFTLALLAVGAGHMMMGADGAKFLVSNVELDNTTEDLVTQFASMAKDMMREFQKVATGEKGAPTLNDMMQQTWAADCVTAFAKDGKICGNFKFVFGEGDVCIPLSQPMHPETSTELLQVCIQLCNLLPEPRALACVKPSKFAPNAVKELQCTRCYPYIEALEHRELPADAQERLRQMNSNLVYEKRDGPFPSKAKLNIIKMNDCEGDAGEDGTCVATEQVEEPEEEPQVVYQPPVLPPEVPKPYYEAGPPAGVENKPVVEGMPDIQVVDGDFQVRYTPPPIPTEPPLKPPVREGQNKVF